jgi:hypothetical protein
MTKLRLFVVGLIAAVLTLGVSFGIQGMALTPAASASTVWSISASPSPGQGNALDGVSCSSPTTCVAVGSGPGGTLIETLSNNVWSVTPAPTVVGTLNGVSCPHSNDCVAVGSGPNGALIETYSNGAWSVTPTPTAGALDGVSCSDANDCVAVGSQILTLSSGAWSVTPSPEVGTLAGVSCISPSECVAVGSVPSGTTEQTLIETLASGTWSVTPSPNGPLCRNGLKRCSHVLAGVSCTATSTTPNCVAVGHWGGYGEYNLVETLSSGGWSFTPVPGTFTQWPESRLDGVSCVDANDCVAVGSVGAGHYSSQVLTLSDGIWSTTDSPNPNPGQPHLFGVSCTSITDCQAAGSYFSVITNGPATLVETNSPNNVGVIVNPTAVHAGLRGVATTGSGFGPNDVVSLYWDSTTSTPLGIVKADPSGGFSTTIRIPETTLGTHILIAAETNSGAQAAAELFVNLH